MSIPESDPNRLFGRLGAGIVIEEDIQRIRTAIIVGIRCEYCNNYAWRSDTMPYCLVQTSASFETWHHPNCQLVRMRIAQK